MSLLPLLTICVSVLCRDEAPQGTPLESCAWSEYGSATPDANNNTPYINMVSMNCTSPLANVFNERPSDATTNSNHADYSSGRFPYAPLLNCLLTLKTGDDHILELYTPEEASKSSNSLNPRQRARARLLERLSRRHSI